MGQDVFRLYQDAIDAERDAWRLLREAMKAAPTACESALNNWRQAVHRCETARAAMLKRTGTLPLA